MLDLLLHSVLMGKMIESLRQASSIYPFAVVEMKPSKPICMSYYWS